MKILDQYDGGVTVEFSERDDDIIPHIENQFRKELNGGILYYICDFTDEQWESVRVMLNGIIPKSIPKKKGT